MTRIFVAIAASFITFAAGAQDIRFVPGKGPADTLADTERAAALLAIDTLAADLKVPREKVELDTVRAVEWPNSSLGCPKPGMAYLDVIKPGHKVTLRVDGQVYVVHEAGNRAFVCRQVRALGGITPQRELVFGSQMLEARRDLAARLGVAESEIQMTGAQEQTWEDAGLGCPEPGMTHPPGKVTGWVLTFEHAKRPFTYHTDLHRTIPCPAIASE